jgi:hypothetical protein
LARANFSDGDGYGDDEKGGGLFSESANTSSHVESNGRLINE